MRRRMFVLLATGAALASAGPSASAANETIVVGGKDFTEQLLMATITADLLRAHGFNVDLRTGMGSTVVRRAMESGQVGVYWEYTGTALTVYDKIKQRLSPQQTYDTVKELDAKKGIVWLDPSQANNTYVLLMTADEAQKLGIQTISDLAKAINGGKRLTFASDAEFAGRPDGLRPLEQAYGFQFGRPNVKLMDAGLTYQALQNHQVDVALSAATDGRIPALHLVVLKDDKDFFPAYALTPLVREDVLKANPKLASLLNGVSAKLDDAVMAKLNASVDVDKKSLEYVARGFLKSQHMI